MLVSHDVQLNSKSIIENSFGQLLCRHRDCMCMCVCVCACVFQMCALDTAVFLSRGHLAERELCDHSQTQTPVPLARIVHPCLLFAK